MADEPFPPPGVDLDHPSVARVYDYYLGGTTNWTIDRQFADEVIREFPLIRPIAKANRLFLHRVVRHLVKQGVRQFVDIGSGVPTMGHAHQVADEVAPGESRVCYVDYEPVAVAHSETLLRESGDPARHAVIHADLRDPAGLWDKIAATKVIDVDEPLALLLIAVLHVQQPPAEDSGSTDDLGPSVVAQYRELLPPGSFLAISHITDQGVPSDVDAGLIELKQMYDRSSSPVIWRSREEIAALFGPFEMVEPGLTWTPSWHPEESGAGAPHVEFPSPAHSVILAGVARKP
ncbi:SAM-dependent methyltransferase [Amycolatopsis jejuensis]|uniref:SAM-dependent methyltransferase n=1 Tax=Amycolatopsis jejuensis TaxID=330084 RepID=UPI00052764EE|nr:SAM-dependent methyltransferase [Amycolatopsis jejuensis]